MLGLISSVRSVPSVEVADDGNLLGVRSDEYELHTLRAIRRLWRRKERAGNRFRGAMQILAGVHGAEHGKRRDCRGHHAPNEWRHGDGARSDQSRPKSETRMAWQIADGIHDARVKRPADCNRNAQFPRNLFDVLFGLVTHRTPRSAIHGGAHKRA
jgi:hypothetical protein